jgi:hypothetical protein
MEYVDVIRTKRRYEDGIFGAECRGAFSLALRNKGNERQGEKGGEHRRSRIYKEGRLKKSFKGLKGIRRAGGAGGAGGLSLYILFQWRADDRFLSLAIDLQAQVSAALSSMRIDRPRQSSEKQ